MDELLLKLKSSGSGCYIGTHYFGVLGYADDLVLLCSTKEGLRKIISISETYAAEYDIIFNGSKSNLLIFGSSAEALPIITVNGAPVPVCDTAVHLGNKISDNISDVIDFGIGRFKSSFNYFMATYGKCQSFVKNKLFIQYCTSFHGSQIWPIYHKNSLRKICVRWRMALRRMWNLPFNTHCDLLPLLTFQSPIDIQLKCRFVKFYKSLVNSNNTLIKYLSNVNTFSCYSTMSKNLNMVLQELNLDISELHNVSIGYIKKLYYQHWLSSINVQYKSHSSVIHELCMIRDGILVSDLEPDMINFMIQFLCTL